MNIQAPTGGTCMSIKEMKVHARNMPPHWRVACDVAWAVSKIRHTKVGVRHVGNI
jgi:hypothetical protein